MVLKLQSESPRSTPGWGGLDPGEQGKVEKMVPSSLAFARSGAVDTTDKLYQ